MIVRALTLTLTLTLTLRPGGGGQDRRGEEENGIPEKGVDRERRDPPEEEGAREQPVFQRPELLPLDHAGCGLVESVETVNQPTAAGPRRRSLDRGGLIGWPRHGEERLKYGAALVGRDPTGLGPGLELPVRALRVAHRADGETASDETVPDVA